MQNCLGLDKALSTEVLKSTYSIIKV